MEIPWWFANQAQIIREQVPCFSQGFCQVGTSKTAQNANTGKKIPTHHKSSALKPIFQAVNTLQYPRALQEQESNTAISQAPTGLWGTQENIFDVANSFKAVFCLSQELCCYAVPFLQPTHPIHCFMVVPEITKDACRRCMKGKGRCCYGVRGVPIIGNSQKWHTGRYIRRERGNLVSKGT